MKIKKDATAYDGFRCPNYPDLSKIQYKFCLGRQLAKTPNRSWLYRECAECKEGKVILDKFKDYKPKKRQAPNWNSAGCDENIGKKKKTRAIVDCVKCKTLIQTQLENIIQCITGDDYSQALKNIETLMEDI